MDYARDTILVTDPAYLDLHCAHIFVAVWGGSNYTHAEAQPNLELVHWIGGHAPTFSFFGDVPQNMVPDDLTQGVKHANWYKPDPNPTQLELPQHYDIAVLPAESLGRVTKPRWS